MPVPIDYSLDIETAHVLFMDIVGFTRRSLSGQVDMLREFQNALQQSSAFQRAAEARTLLCLPTGDGAALVFFRNPVAPLRCALEMAQALRAAPVPLRMGLHSGPICHVPDINGRQNVSGEGINTAQRVMDCGQAGHILASQTVASLLLGLEGWDTYMQDWGEQTAKHGQKVRVYNLVMDGLGNPSLPDRRPASAIPFPHEVLPDRQAEPAPIISRRQDYRVTPELPDMGDFAADFIGSRSMEDLVDTTYRVGEDFFDFLFDHETWK